MFGVWISGKPFLSASTYFSKGKSAVQQKWSGILALLAYKFTDDDSDTARWRIWRVRDWWFSWLCFDATPSLDQCVQLFRRILWGAYMWLSRTWLVWLALSSRWPSYWSSRHPPRPSEGRILKYFGTPTISLSSSLLALSSTVLGEYSRLSHYTW